MTPFGSVLQDSSESKAFQRLFKKHSGVTLPSLEPSVTPAEQTSALCECVPAVPVLTVKKARLKYGIMRDQQKQE